MIAKITEISKRNGSVLLIVIFLIAFIAALVTGMLQINTKEIQLFDDQINAAQAFATAEAGLNHALKNIRYGTDPNCSGQSFSDDTYNVNVTFFGDNEANIISEAVTNESFTAAMKARVKIDDTNPYKIRIDKLRINE
jgi:hypothetical protein